MTTCTKAAETTWSPDDHVTATDCPPAWLLVNSSDELMPLDQPTAMVDALQPKKCRVAERILPGDRHSIGYWSTISPTVIRAHS